MNSWLKTLIELEYREMLRSWIISLLLLSSTGFAQDAFIRNIPVYFAARDSIFPESWYVSPVSGETIDLDTAEYQRSINVISNALAKYPTKVLEENLTSIYVLHTIKFYGTSYGGTYHENVIYLSNRGVKKNYTNLYIEKVFHAEFSSVLLANYETDGFRDEWGAINGLDFNYGTGGKDALLSGKSSEKKDEAFLQAGFLSEYATSSMENDFNAVAKNLFTADEKFWEIYNTYERIKAKTDLFISFYHQINDEFTLEYFQNFLD